MLAFYIFSHLPLAASRNLKEIAPQLDSLCVCFLSFPLQAYKDVRSLAWLTWWQNDMTEFVFVCLFKLFICHPSVAKGHT